MVFSCNRDEKHKNLVFDEYLFKYSKNKTLITRGDFITYKVYRNEGVNEYYLERQEGGIKLIRAVTKDSLEKKNVIQTVQKIISNNKEYGVLGFTHDFSENGIDTKYYFEDGSVLFYIPKRENVHDSYSDYLKTCTKIKEHWYCSNEDW